jgi:hypothetical protein
VSALALAATASANVVNFCMLVTPCEV